MKAIRFDTAVPRNKLGRAMLALAPTTMIRLGRWIDRIYPSLMWSGLMNTYLDEVPEPPLPNDEWVRVNTRYGGICGSDTAIIHLSTSEYYTALTKTPITIGHENVGRISLVGANVKGWSVGDRVVVEPLLWCKPRRFTDLCRYCARGEINLCERVTEGTVSPGLLIGGCRDTGGSWSPSFVAHESQLYRVPDHVSDENALLVEPFAIGLHAALQYFPRDDETVLILGAGIIGLGTLAALRTLGSKARLLVLARYDFQAEAARRLGASEIISAARSNDYYTDIAKRTGARVLQPLTGKRVVIGGVDRTYECVGNDSSLDDAVRLTRGDGTVVIIGEQGITHDVDWSAIFLKELDVRASYTYHHDESFEGKKWRTFDLALDWMERGVLDIGWLVTHRYKLAEYRHALDAVSHRGASKVIKAVFEFS
ncbi:MAG TPA: alcohol dehydrogenase catalytic domain-containing protein [Anaerolineae bacterium]